jgi:hypothetical protein
MFHTRGPIFGVLGIIQVAIIVDYGDIFRLMALIDTPLNSLLDPKRGPTMSKSRSSWNLVPLPAPSTKGGKRGMLKAPGLD